MRCAIVASCLGGFAAAAAAGCSNKTGDSLPPATDWQSAPSAGSSTDELPQAPLPGMRSRPANPHAGLAIGGAAGGGGGDDDDPHAGVDMGAVGGMTGANPHVSGGTDVTRMGLAAPDPDRPIDPSHRVSGTITIGARARDRVKPGAAVFLIAKRAGADGAPIGPPLAVDKLTWSGDRLAFELSDEQAMVAGTELSGNVVVTARYDQDSDALTRQPGDVTGQVSVKVPADHVTLTLDTVLP